MKENNKQIKWGAVISYFTIAFNMVAGLIYTPWMISSIGKNNYGLYTLATSLITMFVMDFGMSAAVTRFVAKYNAEGNQEKVNNFLGMVYKIYLLIDLLILAVIVGVYFFIDRIYSNLSLEELEVFKILYVIVGAFSVISFPFTNLNGVLSAYEKFVQLKMCDLFHKIFIIIAMVAALFAGYGVFALVSVNALSGILTILIKLIIVHRSTPVHVNFHFFDKAVLQDIVGFSVWTTVGSVMQRLIFNITPSIIAGVSSTGAIGVATFGLATTIEGYVYTFSTAINGLFMARISRIIAKGERNEKLMPLMIRVGRIQTLVIGVLTFGFLALGQTFVVDIWRQRDFAESYYCAMLLIIPGFLFMPMQIANTTLIVEGKVKLQAFVYTIMGAVNVICSLVLSKYWGAIGAAFSIFIAYMVRTILFAIIYHRVLHLNMLEFIREAYLKLVPCFIMPTVLAYLMDHFWTISSVYIRFFFSGAVFVAAFAVIVYFFGLNPFEKELILRVVRHRKK